MIGLALIRYILLIIRLPSSYPMAYAQKRTPPTHLLAFKMHDYKRASSSEKLGRLLVVLVDGPESLPLH